MQFIFSDHYDFISLQSYAGHAPGFFAWVQIKGLAVPDEQILLPQHLRPAPSKKSQMWLEVRALL